MNLSHSLYTQNSPKNLQNSRNIDMWDEQRYFSFAWGGNEMFALKPVPGQNTMGYMALHLLVLTLINKARNFNNVFFF